MFCAIAGGGTIDGNGSDWWNAKEGEWPELIRITDGSHDIALWNFTTYDGAFHQIKLKANNVEVAHLQRRINWDKDLVSAPPHGRYSTKVAQCTDGIEIYGKPTYVHHTLIDSGDDNIAVHASHVLVEDCHFGGPAMGRGETHGHGASIGSLGTGVMITLQSITSRRIVFENAEVGPKIKVDGSATSGYVKDDLYEDLTIDNTQDRDFHIVSHCSADYGNDMDERLSADGPNRVAEQLR